MRSSGSAPNGVGVWIGDRLAGRFVVERELGRGGSGVVFAAFDERLGRSVALKVLWPDGLDERQLERFRREVGTGVGHRHLVNVYELYESEGRAFLSMELVDGTSLRDHISPKRRLAEDEVIDIGRQVAAALTELHGRGLVHRDVKPGNVLLARDGTVKLADLGLVRSLLGSTTVTETAMVVGTPAYMAPEQARGGELGPEVDIYGLGLTLFRCLTGEVPLAGDSAVDTLIRRQRLRAPRVRAARPECSRWLERLVRRMLEPDPRERPSAEEVERALERRQLRPRLRRAHWAAGLGAALVLAGGALGLDLLRDRASAGIVAGGRAVHGVNERGEETWRHDLPLPLAQEVRADVTGDGKNELIVVAEAQRPGFERNERGSMVMIVDSRGRAVTRAWPGDLVKRWTAPYPHVLRTRVWTGDLNGDGAMEVVAAGHHPRYYPSAVLVYWPESRAWDDVLHHPGWVTGVLVGRRSHTGTVRLAGVNNMLCKLVVAAELGVSPPERDGVGGWNARLGWPGVENSLDESRRVHWRSYTLLPASRGVPTRLVAADGGGSEVQCKHGGLRLDEWDNPVPGPNAGRDLRVRRLRFVGALNKLSSMRQPLGPGEVVALVDRIRRSAGPLMREAPYRIALAERGARALARVGSLDAAVRTLTAAFADTGAAELELRLCHLLALQGRLEEAAARTRKLVDGGIVRRYDTSLLLGWLGTVMRRPDLVRDGLHRISSGQQTAIGSDELLPALQARVHLWWDEIDAADCEVRTLDLEPAGDALACLARWRLDRTQPGDPEAMERLLDRSPDAIAEVQLALAAAHLGLDHPERAVAPLSATEARLETGLGDDFIAQKLLDLTHAMQVVVLARTGKVDEAEARARELRPRLDPDLLPGLLVAEVLSGRHDS